MPDIYQINLTAIPTAGSEEFGEAAGAHVEIFATADTLTAALQLAVNHVMNRLWVVTKENSVCCMTPALLAHLNTESLQTYHRAQLEGVFSLFTAWPVEEREEGTIEIRPLRDKDNSSDTPH